MKLRYPLLPGLLLFAARLLGTESLSVSVFSQSRTQTQTQTRTCPLQKSLVLSLETEGKDSNPKTASTVQSRGAVSCRRRRRTILKNLLLAPMAVSLGLATSSKPASAYTPDPDKLQESLYFISRVQEATVQQERFMNKLGGTIELRTKLKLTLRLVDKNYKLLDQINYSSAFVTPPEKLVEASEAGYEAVDALASAIEFVKKDENWVQGNPSDPKDAASKDRIAFLTESMQTCREQLLVYTDFMPPTKLQNARYRVEDENIRNRDEFDGDEDAGVYNPVNLPWKPVLQATEAYKPKK